jgi:Spy/CpxP family protein refolding chaperone
MKNKLRTLVMTAAVAFFAFSCQENDDATPAILEAEVDEVVDIVAEELFPIDVLGGTENLPFGMETDVTDYSARYGSDGKPKFPLRNLGSCVEGLDLTEDQVEKARELTVGLFECREEVHEKFLGELREILGKMEAERKEALQLLREEKITPAQFRERMENTRKKFQASMKLIREKHRDTIKPCLREYVKELKELLGEEKWGSLKSCLKEKREDRESND